jgi:hypothetical protein
MKTIITTLALILIVSIGVKAQTKRVDTTKTQPSLRFRGNVRPGWISSEHTFPANTVTLQPSKFIWFNTPDEIMSISEPDSNKTITVKFNRKLVHFINDSTFTFKQP